MLNLERETDPERLRQAARLLDRENARLIEKLVALEKENLRLKGLSETELQLRLAEIERQLANARQALYGDSTEKRRKLSDEKKPDDERKPDETPPEPQKGHGPTQQPDLLHEEEVHRLDEPDLACPQCGGQLAEWEGKFEESELVDVIERKFVVRQVKRQKYRCGCHACVETALGPKPMVTGGRYAPGFAVEVAVAKYLDHHPLQRQVRIMAREGLIVTGQTLWDQLYALSQALTPTYERIWSHVLAQPVIGADETHWKFLGTRSNDTGNKRWQLWTACVDDAVAYRIEETRSKDAAKNVFGDFKGIAVVDGYGVYEHHAKKHGVTIANCWAHVRRKFFELDKVIGTTTRDEILDLIGELFALDRASKGNLEERARLRNEKSRAVVEKIRVWLFEHKAKALPRSAFGRAIDYALERWDGLKRFLEDARIPLSNNASERALRGPVVGRKNHYGSKSRRGATVAAVVYSLCESAKLAGVDPKAYLRRAVERTLEGLPPQLPSEFAAERLAPPA